MYKIKKIAHEKAYNRYTTFKSSQVNCYYTVSQKKRLNFKTV